jgi:hypothetical protein
MLAMFYQVTKIISYWKNGTHMILMFEGFKYVPIMKNKIVVIHVKIRLYKITWNV